MTMRPTGSGGLRPTGSARPSSSVVPYTGAADGLEAGSVSLILAVVFGLGAWAL